MLGVALGLIGLMLMIAGRIKAIVTVCSECRGKVDKLARICPHCRTELG